MQTHAVRHWPSSLVRGGTRMCEVHVLPSVVLLVRLPHRPSGTSGSWLHSSESGVTTGAADGTINPTSTVSGVPTANILVFGTNAQGSCDVRAQRRQPTDFKLTLMYSLCRYLCNHFFVDLRFPLFRRHHILDQSS